MKSDIWIGKKGYWYFYYRFRDSEYYAYSIVGGAFIASLLLLFYVIIPEFTSWFSIRQEVIATQQRIAILQQDNIFISNLDKNTLNAQLETVSHALPPEKGFSAILTDISQAAAKSGVSLNNYSFDVGNISSESAQLSATRYSGVSSLQITVVVDGTIGQVQTFIESIERSLPLAEITKIDGSGQNISITMLFYQKPFPQISLPTDRPLSSISPDKLILLQKLSQWDTATATQPSSLPTGSGSAIPLF